MFATDHTLEQWDLDARYLPLLAKADAYKTDWYTRDAPVGIIRTDGGEFIREEVVLAALLDTAISEADEETVAAFDAAMRQDLNRLEDGIEAAAAVMNDAWQYADADRIREVQARAMVRGARAAAGIDNILEDIRGTDEILDGMVRTAKYYTNNYFNRFVIPDLRLTVDKIVSGDIAGAGREFQILRELMDVRLHNVPYWRLVSNGAASRGYHYGAVKAANQQGYRGYELTAVLDERTTDICQSLNGRKFWTADAVTHMERVMKATEDELPEVDPWVTIDDVESADAATLKANGTLTPPFHGNCRTTMRFFK